MQSVIGAFAIEKNTAMSSDESAFLESRREVSWIDTGFRSVNPCLLPIRIDHSSANIRKMNWNAQPLRDEPRVIPLVTVQTVNHRRKRPHFRIDGSAAKNLARRRCQSRRIQAAAHKICDLIGPKTIANRCIEEFFKPVGVVIGFLEIDRLIDGQCPIPAHTEAAAGPRGAVRRRYALNIGKRRGGWVLVQIEQQKIGDGKVIQFIRDCWMLPDAVQSVAEDHALPPMCIKERLHSKMIARTEQVLLEPIPDGKREITEQVLDTFFTPYPVGSKQQLNVSRSLLDVFAMRGEFPHEVGLRIHARVGNDPNATVEREGLALAL